MAKKILYVLGTVVPVIYGLGLLIQPFDAPEPALFTALYPLIAAIFVAMWIFYFYDVFHNNALDRDRKWLWAAFLLFGTCFAEIAYLLIHVLRDQAPNV